MTTAFRAMPQQTRDVTVEVGGIALSKADAEKLDAALRRFGHHHAANVYCLSETPVELSFYRYVPDRATLEVLLDGPRIVQLR